MTKVFREIIGVVLCMMLLSGVAGAEMTDYKNPKYNFKNIKSVLLFDMDMDQVNIENDIVAKNIQVNYELKAGKYKLPLVELDKVLQKMSLASGKDMNLLMAGNQEEFDKTFGEHVGDYVDAYVRAKIVRYESERTYHPAYTSDEIRTRFVTDEDRDGNKRQRPVEYVETVYHGDYYSTEFYVTIEFRAYDAKTHEEIFSRLDNRCYYSETGASASEDSCKDFFKDFAKLIR